MYPDRPSNDTTGASDAAASGADDWQASNPGDKAGGSSWGATEPSGGGSSWGVTEPLVADQNDSGGAGWVIAAPSAQESWGQSAPAAPSKWDAGKPGPSNVPDSTSGWAPANQADSWEPAGASSVHYATEPVQVKDDAAESGDRPQPSLAEVNIDPSLADLTNDDIYSARDTDFGDEDHPHHEMPRSVDHPTGTKSGWGSEPSWGQSAASSSAWDNEPAPTPWGDEPAAASVDSWDLPKNAPAESTGGWSSEPQSKISESWGASGSSDRPTGLPAPARGDWAAPSALPRSSEGWRAPRGPPRDRGVPSQTSSRLPPRSIDERP